MIFIKIIRGFLSTWLASSILKLKFFIQTPSVLNNCTLCLAFVHGDFLTTAGNSITFVIVLPRKRNGLLLMSTKEATLKGADALIICTEWQNFKAPDFSLIF